MLEFLFVYSCAYFHFSTELLSFIIDLSLIQSTLYWCLLSWNLKKNCRHSWTNNVEITCDTLAVHTKGEANYHERFQSDFKNENFSLTVRAVQLQQKMLWWEIETWQTLLKSSFSVFIFHVLQNGFCTANENYVMWCERSEAFGASLLCAIRFKFRNAIFTTVLCAGFFSHRTLHMLVLESTLVWLWYVIFWGMQKEWKKESTIDDAVFHPSVNALYL